MNQAEHLSSLLPDPMTEEVVDQLFNHEDLLYSYNIDQNLDKVVEGGCEKGVMFVMKDTSQLMMTFSDDQDDSGSYRADSFMYDISTEADTAIEAILLSSKVEAEVVKLKEKSNAV